MWTEMHTFTEKYFSFCKSQVSAFHFKKKLSFTFCIVITKTIRNPYLSCCGLFAAFTGGTHASRGHLSPKAKRQGLLHLGTGRDT